MKSKHQKRTRVGAYALAIALVVGVGLFFVYRPVSAQSSPLHPTFPLLDKDGENVLDSGEPVSTMATCGACHDVAFISEHSFHADVGLSEIGPAGLVPGGRAWDTSPGLFGKWEPLINRYLSPEGDERLDMTTPEWVQLFGARHVGGGPAETSQDGRPLTELPRILGDPETHIVNPETGELVYWDWEESGVVEMNCFLCHTPEPNNEARIETLGEGDFQWAATATLLGTGIVEQSNGDWHWNEDAFDEAGDLAEDFMAIQDPRDENCGLCHGLVHADPQTPLVLEECSADRWSTITTGQILSGQRIADSGLNLSDKEDLSRSYDVHAERVIGCTDCHYSLNNPIYYQESDESQPDHLTFDPRRIDLGEYLFRPLHQFAKGTSAQGTVAPELDDTLRRCESCHSIENTHDWLPYKERHTDALSCETCHVPKMYSPARQYNDWTVLKTDGSAQSKCRGIEQQGETFGSSLISGFEPVLLPRQDNDGSTKLAPYNLITTWYWVYGDPERPVPQRDLQAVWLDGDSYHPEVLAVFDADGDGQLNTAELVIDDEQKEAFIASRLTAAGLENPRIFGEIQPYNINHNVTHGEWATKECNSCHGEESRIVQPMVLADRTPGGATPTFVNDGSTQPGGEFYTSDSGELVYRPLTEDADLYVLGHDNVSVVDWIGAIMFLGTFGLVIIHGSLRFYYLRRHVGSEPELRDVYMYTIYNRLWHWLQTIVILVLLFTGLIIHKPDQFGIFSFRYVVEVHNIMAAILVINALLALFYHLMSGEIQQFLPRPRGFFDQAFIQAKFYLNGIFRGDEHPHQKTRERKLNSLQQVTYFAILNILLPLQIITGALMWGVQRWPDLAAALGGLPLLGPFHTLVAWSFASFIVMHVYLTTTGQSASAGIRAMIMGWDEVEVHGAQPLEPASSD